MNATTTDLRTWKCVRCEESIITIDCTTNETVRASHQANKLAGWRDYGNSSWVCPTCKAKRAAEKAAK